MAINLDHQRNKIASTSEVLTINNTGSLIVPKGTTVQRPGTEEGQIRYNSNNLKLEQYVNNGWKNIASAYLMQKQWRQQRHLLKLIRQLLQKLHQ